MIYTQTEKLVLKFLYEIKFFCMNSQAYLSLNHVLTYKKQKTKKIVENCKIIFVISRLRFN